MLKYIIKRILIMVPMLLLVVLIIFGILELTPGNTAQMILGLNASQEALDNLTEELGLNDPFLLRYARYIIDACRGDLGTSWTSRRGVAETIMVYLPTTLNLSIFALAIALIFGIPLGIIAAVKQYSVWDITGTTLAMILASMPGFWFGLMLIILFSLKLGWLPSNGTQTFAAYILPAITMACPMVASLLRMTRTSMLESIRKDYIRTARAKGQKERVITMHHALKNALLPVITMAGTEMGHMIGGCVTVETVFSISGVGSLIITSIRNKDLPMVAGCAVFLAAMYTVLMLIVDILYAFVDPRIRARYAKTRA